MNTNSNDEIDIIDLIKKLYKGFINIVSYIQH